MTPLDESELRRRFAGLRDLDREQLPGFAENCERGRIPQARHAIFHIRPLLLGAAAILAIAAVWLGRVRSSSLAAVTPAITTWSAPTDVLLRTPGSELLADMPALGASILDKMIPTPPKRGT